MIKDLISIVIPTYNDAKYLESALDDLLFQNYNNFEIIVVNDGSTDNTSKILDEYVKKDNRISIYNKKNGGTGSALNLGFSKAKGEFGTWISSDDNKEVDFLKTLVTFLKNNRDVEYVCSSYYSSYFKSPFKAYHKLEDQFYYCEGLRHDSSMSGDQIIVDDWTKINHKHCFQGVCFMFTMRLKKECGDYLELPGEDYHMSMRMALKSRVGYIDTILGKHNNPEDSLSMIDRKCVLEAERLTKKLYVDSDKWNLNIPKIASFYCGENFSEKEKKYIISFKKMNPDWSVHLYWDTKNDSNLKSKITREIACLVKTINLDSIKVTSDKVAFLSCYVLISQGGLWLRPESSIEICLAKLCNVVPKNTDMIYCYDEAYSSEIIISKKNTDVFKKALSFLKITEDKPLDLLKQVHGTPEELSKKFYSNRIYNIKDRIKREHK
tara:strand:+ start:1035 stop:2345 length:1311 start_codon:yes stop_codon:yes gene_type:complete